MTIVSNKAEKLLDAMRCSTAKWKRRDLDTLYLGFGFEIRIGEKHDIAKHPKYPALRATLPKKHPHLAKGYVTYAVKLIEQLQKLNEVV